MSGVYDPLVKTQVQPWLKAPCSLDIRPEVTSTNLLVREWGQNGKAEGAVLLAESQTQGRGRFERRFFSPVGTGLYMSVLLRPRISAEQVSLITPAAAVAVCRAVRSVLHKDAGIKWVNDVYLNGRKVCGILTEASFCGERLDYVVLGIGVNVYEPHEGFAPEVASVAGAVADTETEGLRGRLAAEILNAFWEIYAALPDTAFMQEYRARSVVIGKRVTVCRGGVKTAATACDMNESGHLLVRYKNGAEEWLAAGEISLRI